MHLPCGQQQNEREIGVLNLVPGQDIIFLQFFQICSHQKNKLETIVN